jgi:dolichol-phosphate mannosyltransferase
MHLDIGYFDHPPMVGWLIWFFTGLLGQTEFAVRGGALTSWLVTLYFLYKLTVRVAGRKPANQVLLLGSVLPLFFGIFLVMFPDGPLVACWAGALYFLHGALIRERKRAWIGAGIFIGLGMLSKYTIFLLGFSAFFYMVFDRQSRKWLLRPEPYIAIIIAVLLFSPVIIWNAMHEWASFSFQGPERLARSFDFALPELLGAAAVLLTPTVFLMVYMIIRSGNNLTNSHEPENPSRDYGLLKTTTLVPFAIFFVLSLFRQHKLNWTAPIWLGMIPYVASFLVKCHGNLSGQFSRKLLTAWPATVAATLFLFGGLLYFSVLGFPGLPFHFENMQSVLPLDIGMADLGKQVESITNDYKQKTGVQPVTVCIDGDRVAGWIAFYAVKSLDGKQKDRARTVIENTSGGHLFQLDSHMYRYWFPLKEFENRHLLIISRKRDHLKKHQVVEKIKPLGDIKEIILRKHGKPSIPIFYQFAVMRQVNVRQMIPK